MGSEMCIRDRIHHPMTRIQALNEWLMEKSSHGPITKKGGLSEIPSIRPLHSKKAGLPFGKSLLKEGVLAGSHET